MSSYEEIAALIVQRNDLLERIKVLEGERDTLKTCLLQMQNAAKDLNTQLHQRDTALNAARVALENVVKGVGVSDWGEIHHALSQIKDVKQ